MFFYFVSFPFPGLFCMWVVYLLPAVLFAGFLYFFVSVDLFLDIGLGFLDLSLVSPGYSSPLCIFFVVFMLFSFSMFKFFVCCRFSLLILSIYFLISLSSFFLSFFFKNMISCVFISDFISTLPFTNIFSVSFSFCSCIFKSMICWSLSDTSFILILSQFPNVLIFSFLD